MSVLLVLLAAILGATLAPALIGPEDVSLRVTNDSTVAVSVVWEASGGWAVGEPDRRSLAPGETSTVPIVARGAPEGRIRAILRPLVASGADVAALVLEARPAPPGRPPFPLVVAVIAAAAVVGTVVAVARRR